MASYGFLKIDGSKQNQETELEFFSQLGCVKVFMQSSESEGLPNKGALSDALEGLLSVVEEGDVVVVRNVECFGNSLTQVFQVMTSLMKNHVHIRALDQHLDTSKKDPASLAFLDHLEIFATMERNFIINRTRQGKESSGNFGGRTPSLSKEQIREIKKSLESGMSQTQLAQDYGVSRMTISRAARARIPRDRSHL